MRPRWPTRKTGWVKPARFTAELSDVSRILVDLYRVVREAVRVGEASYSIKSLERFYMPPRTTEVVSGGDSLVIYDRWRMTGDATALDAIRDYNRDDCLSTLLLRDWLIGVTEAAGLRLETKLPRPPAD